MKPVQVAADICILFYYSWEAVYLMRNIKNTRNVEGSRVNKAEH
jgi:hypothetical protein